jgi:hypothetical protein
VDRVGISRRAKVFEVRHPLMILGRQEVCNFATVGDLAHGCQFEWPSRDAPRPSGGRNPDGRGKMDQACTISSVAIPDR